jgi:radical SAM superfamily enzyme YgiQ (UPF0313 family)
MRIKLISVSVHKGIKEVVRCKKNWKHISIPSLGLIILAALTDIEHEVILINDESEEIDFNDPADLVGISFITPTSLRAYAIADRFREKGVAVVLGGVHASAVPEEAALHCDSVVIGEAENIWPKLLKDFKNSCLQKVYKDEGFIDMDSIPFPRRDLLKKDQYITTNIIQASRGCPINCEFCSVSDLFGNKTRFRSVDKVIEEIKTMDDQMIVFSDDNLAANIPYMRELFTKMIPLRKNWIGEASWTIANNPELLEIVRKSGCKGLLIGFESIHHQDNIKKVSRQNDMQTLYSEAIKRIHSKGIIVLGTFIFGFDNDDENIFKETLEFILKTNIEYVRLGTLIPFPGTPLHRRLKKENRIIETDWRNYIYDPPGICFEPIKLKTDQIRNNLKGMYKKIYSIRRIILTSFRMLNRYRDISFVVGLLIISFSYRRRSWFEWNTYDLDKH